MGLVAAAGTGIAAACQLPPSIHIDLRFLSVISNHDRTTLQILLSAHDSAARRNKNISSQVALQTWVGSGRFNQSIAAALMTIGGLHAPLGAARWNLRHLTGEEAERQAKLGVHIAGFGNSFFKDGIDPSFQGVWDRLADYPDIAARVTEIKESLWRAGKKLYPNAAILTAAVCEIVNWPVGTEDFLFLVGRIGAWTESFTRGGN